MSGPPPWETYLAGVDGCSAVLDDDGAVRAGGRVLGVVNERGEVVDGEGRTVGVVNLLSETS